MRVRKIKSKKKRFIQRLDIMMVIICIIITSIRLAIKNQTNLIELALPEWFIFKNVNIILAIFLFLGNILINLIQKSFWILIIYIPYRISRGRVIKENKRYEVIDNIEYYREEFKELSSSEISLIADLEMETKKDISATILRLYIRGYIDFEDQEIKVIKTDETDKLKRSEQALLFHLKENTLSTFDKENWTRSCINEAMNDGYIKFKNEKKKKHFWGSTFLFLAAILFIIQCFVFFSSPERVSYYGEAINKIEEKEEINQKEVLQGNNFEDIEKDGQLQNYLENNPEATKLLLKSGWKIIQEETIQVVLVEVLGFIASCAIIFIVPMYKLIRIIIYKKVEVNHRYERTEKGKILVEQIAAMQNFIHEFSMLSEKEKEQVKLWDDFLVYAVVLEENENIIDDIYSYKNFKRFKFF